MGAALSRFELLVERIKRITIAEDAFFEHTLSEDIVRIKDIKLSDNAEEQLETALNSDLLKPVEPDKKKNKKT